MTTGKRARRILTSPLAVSASSFFAGGLIRALFHCVDIRFVVDDPASIPHRGSSQGIYIFWHEMMLLPAYSHAREFATLISESQDGELIARTYQRLGGDVIRGSTSHGRIKAFREICRQVAGRNLGIAVDGPRGPVRRVPVGIVRAASITGKPVIPIGIAYEKCVRFGPDRARIAMPWIGSRAWMVAGRPLAIPRANRGLRSYFRLKVQAAMDAVQARAEKLASGQARAQTVLSLSQVREAQEAQK
jgi:lysophospholipid acyltransferase (LPLAT)-like uncharacterized protein